MEFNKLLNGYIQKINCTAKDLCEATELSQASLSRYRSGERIPSYEQMNKLVDAIIALAEANQIPEISEEAVRADFGVFLKDASYDYEQLSANFNCLLQALNISIAELSRELNFDSSHLSRIRLGQRRPSDKDKFITGICQYAVRKKSRAAISELIGCDEKELADTNKCFQELCKWMDGGSSSQYNYISDFLKKLDSFNLDEYIRAIHFDELKVPTVPFQPHNSKSYYGIEAMKQGELDFFKSTVLSKSTDSVFMCSDMPMEDMGQDLDFGKKWMFGIAMMLKKGLHLNIIHNIDRPFNEMMLGLESWIPIYMTGQVSPYYLKGRQNSVYCHFNYVSGQAALTGECIQGHHDEGKYYLTKNSHEVAFYRKKSERLLEKAHPLMEIYRGDSEHSYNAFLNTDSQTSGTRHNILSGLPIYTIPVELLTKILKRHSVYETDGEHIIRYAEKQRNIAENILKNNSVFDDIPVLSEEEFEQYPMILSLSGMFYEKELCYTYEEYQQHLDATKKFAEEHSNYVLKVDSSHPFRNIQIQIHKGQWVMVSKNKTPAIHFIIRHSKMLNAFENFVVPFTEAPTVSGPEHTDTLNV